MRNKLSTALVVFLSLAYAGCTCVNSAGETDCTLALLVAYLTQIAYGAPTVEPEQTLCPGVLICRRPGCILVQENGSFERFEGDFQSELVKWYGDAAIMHSSPKCAGSWGIEFHYTTSGGPSASRSSQVFQVFDYDALVPTEAQAVMRRVRASANYTVSSPGAFEDRQFGLRIDAYEGDPSAFPRAGDPEGFPVETDTYSRLGSADASFLYDPEGPEWQPLQTALELPEGTDFFVVLLEAYEDGVNQESEDSQEEFYDHEADYVQVAIDGGDLPPTASPDEYERVLEDSTTVLYVLVNDYGNPAPIDPASISIIRAPALGTAVANEDGTITYTPDPSVVSGVDTLTYTMSDVEGLVSNEAVVVVHVINLNDAPVAVDDAYTMPPDGGPLIVPAPGILGNDTGANGDALTATLVQDVASGILTLNSSGGFAYYPPPEDFPGQATFTYRVSDGLKASNEATVTLSSGGDFYYDLSVDRLAGPAESPPRGRGRLLHDPTQEECQRGHGRHRHRRRGAITRGAVVPDFVGG